MPHLIARPFLERCTPPGTERLRAAMNEAAVPYTRAHYAYAEAERGLVVEALPSHDSARITTARAALEAAKMPLAAARSAYDATRQRFGEALLNAYQAELDRLAAAGDAHQRASFETFAAARLQHYADVSAPIRAWFGLTEE